MAVNEAPTLPEAPTPPAGNASPEAQAGDYPALFRTLLVRSVESALAAIAPDDPKLDDDARERSLYALSLALDLAEAWPAASQLLLTIAPHMEMQGYWREWLEFLEKALERATVANDLRTGARIHLLIGELYHLLHEYPRAVRHLTESGIMADMGGDKSAADQAMARLAVAYAHDSNLPRARSLAQAVIDRGMHDCTPVGTAWSVLGLVAIREGEWERAIECYERALVMHRRLDNHRLAAQALRNVALAYRFSGKYQEASEYSLQAIAAFAAMHNAVDEAEARMNLGIDYWYLGQPEQALACYAAVEPVFVTTGWPISLARLANNRGLAYQDLGQYERSEQEFWTSVKLARILEDRLETANVLESLGGLYQHMGRHSEAVSVWREALAELALLPEPPRYFRDLLEQRLSQAGVPEEPGHGSPGTVH